MILYSLNSARSSIYTGNPTLLTLFVIVFRASDWRRDHGCLISEVSCLCSLIHRRGRGCCARYSDRNRVDVDSSDEGSAFHRSLPFRLDLDVASLYTTTR